MEPKLRSYDGSGDVKVFLEKVSLHSSLKSYTGEKAAQNIASKLEGRAFDVYMRLTAEDKRSVEKITNELLSEFEKGNQNRETAIFELNNRKRHADESAQTFAYKLMELVKLAYPSFEDNVRKTIAKDYFVKGIHPKMQIALKALPEFDKADINKLASETTRLQLAGIDSFVTKGNRENCMNVDSPSIVDEIADKVIEKLKGSSLGNRGNEDGGQGEIAAANYTGNYGTTFNQNRRRGRGQSYSHYNKPKPALRRNKCRACQSTDHFYRNCPSRFCQACGERGHDAWSKSCTKFQQ